MAKLSVEEIEHIAKLARLELTPTEKKQYAEQISDILVYVEKLKEVNTKGAKSTNQVTELENVWREDKIVTRNQQRVTSKEMLKNAPRVKDGYIKVKAVL